MSRRLPPLTAVRAFEAAARHGSFTRAANELHVTQAAISHQIKQLEDWLELRLFDRFGHMLTLTADGKAYLPDLSAALDLLANATERLAPNSDAGVLRITALPSFVTKWLMPRLNRFRQTHPHIELHVVSSLEVNDFSRDEFDLGIRLGLGRWPGVQSELISPEWLSPVCSPALMRSIHELDSPDDLRFFTLLHDQPRDLWPRWLEMAGASLVDGCSGPGFSDSALVLQAAIEGHGVALGRVFLASSDLAAGRLHKPFALNLPNDYSYWLVYPKASLNRPRIAAFRDWLLAEIHLPS